MSAKVKGTYLEGFNAGQRAQLEARNAAMDRLDVVAFEAARARDLISAVEGEPGFVRFAGVDGMFKSEATEAYLEARRRSDAGPAKREGER